MLLNCHTYYSFRYGTLSVDNLLDEAQQKGYECLVLSDINNTSACLDTIRKAQQLKIRVIAGIDLRNGMQQKYVGIAMNNEGFRELNAHLSLHLHSGLPFDDTAPAFSNAYIVYPLHSYKGWPLRDNEFIGIAPGDLRNLHLSAYSRMEKKFVALHEVSFSEGKEKRHFETHRLLRCIDENIVLSKLSRDGQAKGNEYMPFRDALYSMYAGYPQIIFNTEELLRTCSISFDYDKLKSKNLKHYRSSQAEDLQLLREKCEEGLSYRYSNVSDAIRERIRNELSVIEQRDFASYFLINWDITNYAQHRGFYHVGRGSGANSIVAYLLRITDVDPIELDLYFERFINIYRSNAPDFDIDFSWTDRDDITDYIFNTFNRNNKGNVALLGAYNTFKNDAAIHQLGKVFGLPPNETEQLKKARGPKPQNDLQRLVLSYAKRLEKFPSHLSIHSSGIIISEEPVNYYSATSLPPKGHPTTQFSMLEAEDIGLYKFDILSQRGLGKIKDTLQIVKETHNTDIDIHNIEPFTKDEKVKSLMREGKAIGCFYVESPAMRMLLTKLKADDYLRLVAASSIIRPGVAQSGMMREYILRFREPKLREDAEKKLPLLYDILRETYGVMVYQEDVIKVAHIFAGISLADADQLRRGMSWKFKERSEFSSVQETFFLNCYAKGYDHETISGIWHQIQTFANFAFSKGHSASYAVESYQALYLKAHYPVEYMVATLNNGGGFYRTELYIHEARQHGAVIITPCINNSGLLCTLEGKNVYLGLQMITGIETSCLNNILHERSENGPFRDLRDLVTRMPAFSLEQARLLIRAGAFGFTGRDKKEMLWEVHTLLRPNHKKEEVQSLFRPEAKSWDIPKLSHSRFDDAFDERELFGFSLLSPFEMLRDRSFPKLTARDLKAHLNREITIAGYLVNIKQTQTLKSRDRMNFGTFTDINGDWIDTVHFPESAARFPFTGSGCYLITGKVTEEYDFISIEVSGMKRLPMVDREQFESV